MVVWKDIYDISFVVLLMSLGNIVYLVFNVGVLVGIQVFYGDIFSVDKDPVSILV